MQNDEINVDQSPEKATDAGPVGNPVEPDSSARPDTTEPVDTKEKAEANNQRLKRGSKPPKVNLPEAVAIIKDFYELAGGEGSEDALSEIMDNSVSSSTFRAKLGNLRVYDLLESEGSKVAISPVGLNVVAPKEPLERMTALKKAFLGMDVYKNVYEKYAGRMLPQDEFLINSVAELVPRTFAQDWLQSFKDSALFAGLLIDRGEGKFQVRSDVGSSTPVSKPMEQPGQQTPVLHAEGEDDRKDELPENAIRRIQLTESNKAIWIGTDANMFQIRSGKDMDFVLALIKLFDEYERPTKGREVNDEI
ncbi:MAG: hypothetical protein ABL984_01925 [Pyrinomonadaceae bacterium]